MRKIVTRVDCPNCGRMDIVNFSYPQCPFCGSAVIMIEQFLQDPDEHLITLPKE